MSEPKTPDLAVDPNLAAEQARANKTLVDQLQLESMGDQASLMARFGTKLALQGGGMSPLQA